MSTSTERHMVKAGEVVRFRKEWQDAGDDQYVWRAVEDASEDRVLVVCELGLPINPTQVVWLAMLTPKEG